MIQNPDNFFEELQNDVAAQIMATAPFNSITFPDGSDWKALTEDEGDIQFEFDTMIGVVGLSIVVYAAEGDVDQPDIPGPLLTNLNFEVGIFESPVFNRSEQGTGLRLARAANIVFGTLHGFQPPSARSPLYAKGIRRGTPQRLFATKDDTNGVLTISRRCLFSCPLVSAAIT
jgi:hypothetical protein